MSRRSAPGPWFCAGAGFLVGVVGGLIGLGGAEFRLPILVGVLGFALRTAVPVNAAISLVTLAAAIPARAGTVSLAALAPQIGIMAAMIAGAMAAAFLGAGLVARLPHAALGRIILALLLALGVLMIAEAFLTHEAEALLPSNPTLRAAAAVVFGLVIGLVGSLLGVAGGELIIPTLVLGYGVPITLAGSMSPLISLPAILVGLARYRRRGLFPPWAEVAETALPMALGSVLGVAVGGQLVAHVSPEALKAGLGLVLIWSAARVFRHLPQ